jgi:hypothetical protein
VRWEESRRQHGLGSRIHRGRLPEEKLDKERWHGAIEVGELDKDEERWRG